MSLWQWLQTVLPKELGLLEFDFAISCLNCHNIVQESTDQKAQPLSSKTGTIIENCLQSTEVLDLQTGSKCQKMVTTFYYTSKYHCTCEVCNQQASLLTEHSWCLKLCRDYSICSKYIRGFKILIGSTVIWKFLCDWEYVMNHAQLSLLLAPSRNIYDSSQK